MSTTTLTYTMDDLKSEELGQYSWHNNRNPLPMPARMSVTYDSSHSVPSYDMPYHASHNSHAGYRTLPPQHSQAPLTASLSSSRELPDLPAISTRPPLTSHNTFPSLKRSYPSSEAPSHREVNDAYEVSGDADSSKPSINPDHRLLSFTRMPDRSTVLDQHGRPRQLDITAQIHGMFFLSEIATSSGDGVVIQPELTCYRRNLFQISGSVTGPSGQLSMLNEKGQATPIVSQELAVSAMESVDNHVVRLIVIPWKTPPPNAPAPQATSEQEPTSIPIFQGINDQDMNTDLTVQPIAWRRLQFRIATANNGRRKELQQHFVLRLTLTATLATGAKVITAEATTAPIVVRGRSPRNFQSRKEIPLLGSSASSRGHSQYTSPTQRDLEHAESVRMPRPSGIDLPKRAFQFDSSQLPPSPLLHRSTHGQWNTSQQESIPSTTTPNYPPPNSTPGWNQVSTPISETAITSSMHSTPMLSSTTSPESSRPPFYHSSTAPMPHTLSYMDGNPRPSKSPRHVLPPDLTSIQGYSGYEQRPTASSSYSAQPVNSHHSEPREYFPPVHQWTTTEQAQGLYQTSMPPPSAQHYTASSDNGYVKSEQHDPHYTWGQQ